MLSRREVLGGGLAVSALGAVPASASLSPIRRWRPETTIVDRDLPAALDIASAWRHQSSRLHLFAGDPGPLWMNRLEPLLRERPAVLAGYTSAATLFCLQILTRDYALELAARSPGPVGPDDIASIEGVDAIGTGAAQARFRTSSAPLDLRDPRLASAAGAITWVLAPKRN